MRRDDDPARPSTGQLDREPAELGRKRDERAQDLEVGLVDNRDVDGVRNDATLECGHDLLRDDHPRTVLRLVGRRSKVWRDDDTVELEQRPFVRLRREDVEGSARELARDESLGESLLVEQRSRARH